MMLKRTRKRCPVCGQIMTRKKKSYDCPDCGTRLVGDTMIRPKLSGNALRGYGNDC